MNAFFLVGRRFMLRDVKIASYRAPKCVSYDREAIRQIYCKAGWIVEVARDFFRSRLSKIFSPTSLASAGDHINL